MSATEPITLGDELDGELWEPGEPGYVDTCTLFNAAIFRTPLAVVRCRSIADVVRAVNHAREHTLPISARSGGHSAAGWSLCEGGLVLDMRDLDSIEIDHDARTVTAGGGCLTGAIDRALCEHGLATVTGRVSTTGIAGFTLGGGSGTLERRFGFAIDNMLAAEIVLADGSHVRADPQSHSDLFWALRGGGSNYGIVTSLTFRVHDVGPMVTGGLMLYEATQAEAVLRNMRDALDTSPDHVGGYAVLLYGPDDESIPERLRGEPVVAVFLCHSGPQEDADTELAPFRNFGEPAADFIEPMLFADLQCMMDDPAGYRNYMTSEHLPALTDEVIEIAVRRARTLPAGPGWLGLMPWGGAVSRVQSDTPITNRQAKWVMHPGVFWTDPADDGAVRAWIGALREEIRPHTSGAVWLNWIGDEGSARVRAAFGDAGYRRLQVVKSKYDPGNLFRSNHNVAPEEHRTP